VWTCIHILRTRPFYRENNDEIRCDECTSVYDFVVIFRLPVSRDFVWRWTDKKTTCRPANPLITFAFYHCVTVNWCRNSEPFKKSPVVPGDRPTKREYNNITNVKRRICVCVCVEWHVITFKRTSRYLKIASLLISCIQQHENTKRTR